MSTRIHMSQSVRGALANWNGRQWNEATEWITRNDGSKFATGEELEHRFQEMLDQGIEKIPVGDGCDNFDPVKGCMGHLLCAHCGDPVTKHKPECLAPKPGPNP